MELERIPAPLPLFDHLGDQAAALLLESIGVVIKVTPEGYQLRSGPRGRLTKPPEPSFSEAIRNYIDQGPQRHVFCFLPELFLCCAFSLSDDTHQEVLEACQEALQDAFLLQQAREAPREPERSVSNKVIPFPSRSETP